MEDDKVLIEDPRMRPLPRPGAALERPCTDAIWSEGPVWWEDGAVTRSGFDVVDGRYPRNGRVFAVIEPGLSDGFRLDADGNLFTSSADGIQVYAPDGTRLGKIVVPEVISNCTFGGPDRSTLFITASTSPSSIELATRGSVLP
ncbi:SMP-30/gluconolactonase/LRE family protein [Rhizobium sp. SYY.PMSO]|uniref:SMP-30/gluconolactonase/LRE family protein n=1 Tax=Rhizobium sp. SYY.PMSO TaxID=3382192 RepID=UPI00399024DB